MPRLVGFRKNTNETSSRALAIIEKSYLNRTQYGEFNTVDEVQGLIDTLGAMPQTEAVQEKIVDLKNKQLQIGARLNDILGEKNVFETDLQGALNGSAQANIKNMRGLIGSYAAIYGDAAERYRADVMRKITERYGTTATIPQETTDYMKTLDDKAKFYASLFNSYNFQDPATGKLGLLNPNAFAVTVDTNPTNGSITRLEIVPSGDVSKGYMRTDTGIQVMNGVPAHNLPVYLRTFDGGVASDGKPVKEAMLGNIKYRAVMTKPGEDVDTGGAGVGILEAQERDDGFFGIPFSDSPDELYNKSIKSVKENGINLSSDAYSFNSNDIPKGSMMRMGNRMFYSTEKDGEVLEISGKTMAEKQANLEKYLGAIGKDPATLAPFFVDRSSLYAPDGSYKVKGNIDENFFVPPSPTSATPTLGAPMSSASQSATPVMAPGSATSTQAEAPSEPSFFAAKNRLNKPDEPQSLSEIDQMKGINNLIDKGKQFFQSKVSI